jgi:hypothetical protein
MKKLLFLCLLIPSLCFAQTKDVRDYRHIFNYGKALTQYDIYGTVIKDANGNPVTQFIEANRTFHIRNIVNYTDAAGKSHTRYIILLDKFGNKFANAAALNITFVESAPGVDIYFGIDAEDYLLYAEKLEHRGSFIVGASTTLIKIRPGKKSSDPNNTIYSEFGNDFNIGFTAGLKLQPYRKVDFSGSIIAGFSFTNIKATPYTTKNFLTTEENEGCITVSLGLLFEIQKFQISTFTGLDIMPGQVGQNWIYRNRPWIGLGFGYQIFRAASNDKQKDTN